MSLFCKYKQNLPICGFVITYQKAFWSLFVAKAVFQLADCCEKVLFLKQGGAVGKQAVLFSGGKIGRILGVKGGLLVSYGCFYSVAGTAGAFTLNHNGGVGNAGL